MDKNYVYSCKFVTILTLGEHQKVGNLERQVAFANNNNKTKHNSDFKEPRNILWPASHKIIQL
jgi:hypothetical protein